MKRSWSFRFIFIVICLCIVFYIGMSGNKFKLVSQREPEYHLVINEIMVNNRNSIRDMDGDFEGWIEIYNKGDSTVNLNGFGLSNDYNQPFMWTFPNQILEPKSFCIVWLSGKNISKSDSPMHTNFKLKNKDKVVILTASHKKWQDIFLFEIIGDNISFGRKPDGSSGFYGFDEGTPGKSNNSEILVEGSGAKRLDVPNFSCNGGFYTHGFDLTLTTNRTESAIYYTLDGSVPTEKSERYVKPITISVINNRANIVRARVYKEGYPKSKIITKSYFVEDNIFENYNIPVVSLVTDPRNLFDYEIGIYVSGKIFDQWVMANPDNIINQITPANYNQKGKNWERVASVEFYQPDGTLGITQDVGMRIHGGYSRASNLKPLSLFARDDYDDSDFFEYDFFNGKSLNLINNHIVNKFSRLLLRNSSTDSNYALFRDAFIQSLIPNTLKIDTQNSQPCILYINGEYYGIHNIREAYDKQYISSHYDIVPEDVVMIKNPSAAGVEIQEGYIGDEMHYNRMILYIHNNDLIDDKSYNFVKTQIDIQNFIEYNVLQIYCDNRDWPGNNVRVWRKRTESYNSNALYGHDGRWRWMIYDLDYGFGLHKGEEAAGYNSLQRATEPNGPEWPNPSWSTFLLRSLLENIEFKNQFINIFADRLNTIFLPEIVQGRIEEMQRIYYPNIEEHILRWDLHDNDIESWKDEIEVLKKFAAQRPECVRNHIVEYFGLGGIATIKLSMNEGGQVRINSLNFKQADTPWQGIYFKDIPVTIEALPQSGYEFIGWEGFDISRDKILTINLKQSIHLRASFKKSK